MTYDLFVGDVPILLDAREIMYNILVQGCQMIDDFGNVVTLYSWTAIIARMDFFLSEGEE